MVIRQLDKSIGTAVAERTILRRDENGRFETWNDVANRVAFGNASLVETLNLSDDYKEQHFNDEYALLYRHLANGSLLSSGRHLQHGDATQPGRPKEVFVNCATSATTFTLFYLLMSGCGVGRCYDNNLMVVNWDNAPNLRVVIDEQHPDYNYLIHESVREAKHKYRSEDMLWYTVEDSREGWAKAIEMFEFAAFEKIHKDKILVLDFSKVRCKGSPIKGMQNRPASGPSPLMEALIKLSTLKGSGMEPWLQAMYADHYMAECVLVGGARRSSRMAVKYWKEKGIYDFINVKRGGFLWTSNNSIGVDKEFWTLVQAPVDPTNALSVHAHRVFNESTKAAYDDKTGEPGFVNVDKLVRNDTGLKSYVDGMYVGSAKFQVEDNTITMMSKIARRVLKHTYNMIVNPCGEICLLVLGDFCTIADLVPYFCDTLDEFEEVARAAVRFLVRVNTMDSVYSRETKRTNRIGISLTGIHEWFWAKWGLSWHDIIDESKSQEMWNALSRIKRAIRNEAVTYSKLLGVNVPHTDITIKPAGTTSKLFALSEGAHLPAMIQYLRWVQFREDDPLVEVYKARGYPFKNLKVYKGTTVIGFPTETTIAKLGMGDKLVTASQATPEEQFKYLMLLEKYWIVGVDEDGSPLVDTGNQVSYTLKFDRDVVSYEEFTSMLKKYQPFIKCVSVMPHFKQDEGSAYEYIPEQAITRQDFEQMMREIEGADEEIGVIDLEQLKCAGGACPII